MTTLLEQEAWGFRAEIMNDTRRMGFYLKQHPIVFHVIKVGER